jgi:hypothetical protein
MTAGIRAGGASDGYFVVQGSDRISIDSVGKVTINANIASTSITTGSLIVTGGLGVGGSLNIAGSINPSVTNTHDLGTSTLRWRNLYTQDLHLSNGIGDYTVIEGEENLYLVNNKTNKAFKFNLTEVDLKEVPCRSATV